ncbi:hypothetical protein H2200_003311 [Cladophialophora chaetospira]|uniref:YCII-related domain-containing protein n=1 Tax=Cladophialophora chaetospira TaxID=386627 RepID=A0AA39CLB3_9EURO|nr:hypothetical protein H2200_003311 [Cladophialophora chaetospira]
MPKFAVLVHASKDSESGQMPTSQEFEEMDAFNKKYIDSGALLHANGFLASSKGARVLFSKDSAPTIKYGPFELENLVSGYWILKLDSMDEAIEFAQGVPFKDGSVEVRQVAGPEDFAEVLTEEQKREWEERSQAEDKTPE